MSSHQIMERFKFSNLCHYHEISSETLIFVIILFFGVINSVQCLLVAGASTLIHKPIKCISLCLLLLLISLDLLSIT